LSSEVYRKYKIKFSLIGSCMCINVISNGKMVHFLVVMVDKSTLRINGVQLKCVVVKRVKR